MAYATSTPKTYPAQQWRMPPLSTVFLCDDCKRRTLGEMLDGVADEDLPKNDEDVLMVLERYGADWTSPIVTYSFMQREEALAALDDSDRYQNAREGFTGIADMHWAYDYLVNETIGQFVATHMPDAHGWASSSYSVTSLDGNDGQAYRVELDIPTSAQDCWVTFEIAIPTYETEPMVLFFQAIRSGVGDDAETSYVCHGLDGEWQATGQVDD